MGIWILGTQTYFHLLVLGITIENNKKVGLTRLQKRRCKNALLLVILVVRIITLVCILCCYKLRPMPVLCLIAGRGLLSRHRAAQMRMPERGIGLILQVL